MTTPAQWQERFKPWLNGATKNGGREFVAFCPACEEPGESNSPSGSFNFEKNVFMCFGRCGKGMSLNTIWQVAQTGDSDEKPSRPSSSSKSTTAKTKRVVDLPTAERIQEWVDKLFSDPELLKPFKEKRGLSNETIEKYNVGYRTDQKRYTIPIYDADGKLINVRGYRMNAAKAEDKLKSVDGHGSAALYLPDALEHDEVILTEGETDALVGREHGLNTMSHTTGAGSFQERWAVLFDGKTVFVCYDDDEGGSKGAARTASIVAKFAAAVYIIDLGIGDRIKGADMTNYFVDLGHSTEDFLVLMEEARVSKTDNVSRLKELDAKPLKLTVEHSMNSDFAGVPVLMTATVSGKVNPPYMMPKRLEYSCGMNAGEKCQKCPLMLLKGKASREVSPKDPYLMQLLDKSEEQRRKQNLAFMDIPTTCQKVTIGSSSTYSVEELIVVPSVDSREEESQNPIDRTVYSVGPYKTPINTTFEITGASMASPRDGRAIFQAWDTEPVDTDIDKFEMDMETKRALEIFRPDKGQTPLEKMEAIAADMAANVTSIYGRPELHMAYDLTWHSVMDFKFGGKNLGKGWLELLVMGDTRTGKSEVATRLRDHYHCGVLKTCEGASYAGLVGGASQRGSSKSWMITWGVIPLNDRRLVILDEVSGIKDKNIIDQMSSIRSSGIAQITKIQSQTTSARTRLIWISNPVDGRTISEMSRGAIDAIEQLVPNPEDIARFDIAMSAASSDVPLAEINRSDHAKVVHQYTEELSATLLMWAWSRKADDIWFAEGVEELIYDRAMKIGQNYVPEPPLIQGENIRVKIARIAVAIAARTFSTDRSGNKVVVKKQHVKDAVAFLNRIYGMKSFGYSEHSWRVLVDRKKSERNTNDARRYLLNHPDVLETLKAVILDNRFRNRDFEDRGMMRDESAIVVKQLSDFGMIRRMSKGYLKMEPPLIEIVKQLERESSEESIRLMTQPKKKKVKK
jgi:hypothetical protein